MHALYAASSAALPVGILAVTHLNNCNHTQFQFSPAAQGVAEDGAGGSERRRAPHNKVLKLLGPGQLHAILHAATPIMGAMRQNFIEGPLEC